MVVGLVDVICEQRLNLNQIYSSTFVKSKVLQNFRLQKVSIGGNNVNNLISGIVNYFMSDLVKLMCGIVK